jgi:anti-anti-sigma factor
MSPTYFGVALTLEEPGDRILVRVDGDLDPGTAPVFEATVAAAEALSAADVAIDLSTVGFVGVAGARAIARAVARAEGSGRAMSVEHAPAVVRRLLALLGQDVGETSLGSSAAEAMVREGVAAVAQSLHALVPGTEAVSVTSAHGPQLTTLFATRPVATELDQLQYKALRGPCVEAVIQGQQMYAPDLEHESRWPDFADAASGRGIKAVLSTPLVSLTDAARADAASTNLALNLYAASDLDAELRELVSGMVSDAGRLLHGAVSRRG